jgi:predicted phosphodiesterase
MPRGNCGSMKIQILSDIHLEFSQYQIETVEDTNIIIIAGDFATARKLGELKAVSQSVSKQVFFVAGNHDYYDGNLSVVNKYLEQIELEIDTFHFLNNSSFIYDDVKLIGCTLWSNFDLAPKPEEYARTVGSSINDFWKISKLSEERISRFTPSDCRKLNEESRNFLKMELSTDVESRSVVITHFMPSPKSIHPRFEHDILNPFFCCNCENLMEPNVPLWIHGHTHDSMDYFHKGTHVIANPKGYYSENKKFNGRLTIDL